MKIELNHREEDIQKDELTVNQLIEYKNFTFKLLVTRLNGQLVRRHERDQTIVKHGDKVEILHLISGG